MDVTQVLVYRSELVISCSMDKKLCLWSIKDHLLLSHLKLDFRPTYLGFDRLQKNLMLGGQDGRVVSLINPFGSQNPVHVVPYKYSSLFLLFVKAAIEKEIEHFDSY